jgi:hypothetical protein
MKPIAHACNVIDGKWNAFAQYFNRQIASPERLGRPQSLGIQTKAHSRPAMVRMDESRTKINVGQRQEMQVAVQAKVLPPHIRLQAATSNQRVIPNGTYDKTLLEQGSTPRRVYQAA